MDTLLLIDGNNLINRAFYALPPLKSSSGELVSAVYGFANMLISSIDKLKPQYVAVAFDLSAPTFRHRMYEGYKATRNKMPDDLAQQLPITKEMLKVMGICVVESSGIEADDIIGTLAKKYGKSMQCYIFSGDKDLLQIVDKNISIYMPQKGIGETAIITVDEMKDKFGYEANQVVDLKSLMGDSSDNIPGVPGVGEKTALMLLDKYNSLESVYSNIDEITGKLKEKLSDGKDKAELSHILATIDTDCGVDVATDDMKLTFPFSSEVKRVFVEYNFRSLLNREYLFKDVDVEDNNIQQTENKLVVIDDVKDALELLITLRTKNVVSVHLSGDAHFAIGDNIEYVLTEKVFASEEVLNLYSSILASNEICKIIFDVKSFMYNLPPNVEINNYFDISLAIYLVDQTDRMLETKDIVEMAGVSIDNIAVALYQLYEQHTAVLTADEMKTLYYNIELPLVKVLFDMERNGIKIDRNALMELSKKYEEEMKSIQSKIYLLAGREFNINSTVQLADILFTDLKLQYTGKKGTSIEVLEAIADQHIIVPELIRYRKIAKLLSTYLIGFLPYLDDADKVHTTYLQTFTSTGRLASRAPNLQNIPIRDEESKVLRKMFVSSFDRGYIISADYNQIELRLLAHYSQDPHMLSDFNAGKDIHKSTAAKIFGVDIADVTSAMRRIAKTVNFGIIYGISQFGLSKTLGVSNAEAKEFIDKYFYNFPSIKANMEKSIAFAKEHKYVVTMFGRRRKIGELSSSNPMIRKFGERVAINTPLQGSASDIIKLAMLKVENAIQKANIKSKLILQIHDELIVDTHPDEIDIVKKILAENMNNVVELLVPLTVDISVGRNWLECE